MPQSPRTSQNPPSSAARRRASQLAAVALGGLLGSAARAGVTYVLPVDAGAFPTATLLVNLLGSFLLGVYLVRREGAVTTGWSVRFWVFGVFGSFTTFSAFSLDVVRLIDGGHVLTAGAYTLGSVVGGLFAAMLGQRVTTRPR